MQESIKTTRKCLLRGTMYPETRFFFWDGEGSRGCSYSPQFSPARNLPRERALRFELSWKIPFWWRSTAGIWLVVYPLWFSRAPEKQPRRGILHDSLKSSQGWGRGWFKPVSTQIKLVFSGRFSSVCWGTVTYHTNMTIQYRTGRVYWQSFPKVDFSQVELLLLVVNHANTVPTNQWIIMYSITCHLADAWRRAAKRLLYPRAWGNRRDDYTQVTWRKHYNSLRNKIKKGQNW